MTVLPKKFSVIARTDSAPYAAIADEARKYYGLEFHPEVYHTPDGKNIIKNFLDICGVSFDWTMASFFETQKSNILAKVKSSKVICGLSGGVDSSVVAVLLHKILGDQLTCIYIDNGLMRKNESEQVVSMFKENYNIPLIHVDAKEIFLRKLEGVTDPEQKRKIIGNVFIDVLMKRLQKLVMLNFLRREHYIPM